MGVIVGKPLLVMTTTEAAVTASLTPKAGVTYTDGFGFLECDQIAAFAAAISNNPEINRTTTVVYLDTRGVHRKLSVRDTVGIKINNASHYGMLIGFNTDILSDASAYGYETATGKCGMTFGVMTVVKNGAAAMNSTSTNEGGWAASLMRNTTMAAFLETIPSEWRAVLKARSLPNNKGTSPTTDILALLSESDVGSNGYAYYASGGSLIKTDSAGSYDADWWLRDAVTAYSTAFRSVGAGGSIMDYGADYKRGTSPSFAV